MMCHTWPTSKWSESQFPVSPCSWVKVFLLTAVRTKVADYFDSQPKMIRVSGRVPDLAFKGRRHSEERWESLGNRL